MTKKTFAEVPSIQKIKNVKAKKRKRTFPPSIGLLPLPEGSVLRWAGATLADVDCDQDLKRKCLTVILILAETITFLIPAFQFIYLPNRPAFAWALTHCLVLEGNCYFLHFFCNHHFVTDLCGTVTMSPNRPRSPFLWSATALRGLTKGVTGNRTKEGKTKTKEKKVPLTTFGVPASPCCFFMWLSRVRWDLKDLSHI